VSDRVGALAAAAPWHDADLFRAMAPPLQPHFALQPLALAAVVRAALENAITDATTPGATTKWEGGGGATPSEAEDWRVATEVHDECGGAGEPRRGGAELVSAAARLLGAPRQPGGSGTRRGCRAGATRRGWLREWLPAPWLPAPWRRGRRVGRSLGLIRRAIELRLATPEAEDWSHIARDSQIDGVHSSPIVPWLPATASPYAGGVELSSPVG
jgi:hypothetical protein